MLTPHVHNTITSNYIKCMELKGEIDRFSAIHAYFNSSLLVTNKTTDDK